MKKTIAIVTFAAASIGLTACGLPTGHTGETTGAPQTCHQQQLPGRGGSWLPLDGAHSYATKADCVNDRNRKD